MAVENKKQFLDYAGLSTFWGIITNRFADKDKTITGQEITFITTTSDDNDVKGKETQYLVTTLADASTQVVTELPLANRTKPGLMTPDHFTIVDDLHANIEKMAPFAGLQLANEIADKPYTEEVSLTGRKATIALRYDTSEESGVRKAYISLLDPNYPAEGRWNTRTQEQFEAAMNAAAAAGKSLVGWTSYTDDGVTQYWQWSEAGKSGPVNALGKPIEQKPISKIDVTDLLRTGLLQSTDVVSKGGKTMLKLTFLVKSENGADVPEDQYIDVTDLVDIYEAGDGVEIVTRSSEPTVNPDGTLDDQPTTTKIQLTYATDTKRGALRTGYVADADAIRHYAVQLVKGGDADGKAYVVVPWDTHTVEVFTTGTTDANEDYLKITKFSDTETNGDGSIKHNHKFQIEVADGIKKAETLARTAAQNIYGDTNYVNIASQQLGESAAKGEGKNWTITLDQTVKDSLALADSAVQTVTISKVDRDGRSKSSDPDLVLTPTGVGAKGEKAYDISLGARTVESLQNADSAIQTINLFGTEIRNASDNTNVNVGYTEEQLTKDIALGNAIKLNKTTVISKDDNSTDQSVASYDNTKSLDNLPTVKAVKTYVEEVKADTTSEYEQYVADTVASLDSKVEAGTIDASDTAQGKVAKALFTKIVIKDGKLVGPDDEADENLGKSEVAKLSIEDITDFRSLTDNEIKTICGINID